MSYLCRAVRLCGCMGVRWGAHFRTSDPSQGPAHRPRRKQDRRRFRCSTKVPEIQARALRFQPFLARHRSPRKAHMSCSIVWPPWRAMKI